MLASIFYKTSSQLTRQGRDFTEGQWWLFVHPWVLCGDLSPLKCSVSAADTFLLGSGFPKLTKTWEASGLWLMVGGRQGCVLLHTQAAQDWGREGLRVLREAWPGSSGLLVPNSGLWIPCSRNPARSPTAGQIARNRSPCSRPPLPACHPAPECCCCGRVKTLKPGGLVLWFSPGLAPPTSIFFQLRMRFPGELCKKAWRVQGDRVQLCAQSTIPGQWGGAWREGLPQAGAGRPGWIAGECQAKGKPQDCVTQPSSFQSETEVREGKQGPEITGLTGSRVSFWPGGPSLSIRSTSKAPPSRARWELPGNTMVGRGSRPDTVGGWTGSLAPLCFLL